MNEATYAAFASKLSKNTAFDPAMIIAILMALLPLLCPTPTPAGIKEQAASPGFRLRAKVYAAFLNAGMSVKDAKNAAMASFAAIVDSTEEEVGMYLKAAQEG